MCVCVCVCFACLLRKGKPVYWYSWEEEEEEEGPGWRREIPLFALPWFQNNPFLPVSAASGQQRIHCCLIPRPLCHVSKGI